MSCVLVRLTGYPFRFGPEGAPIKNTKPILRFGVNRSKDGAFRRPTRLDKADRRTPHDPSTLAAKKLRGKTQIPLFVVPGETRRQGLHPEPPDGLLTTDPRHLTTGAQVDP
jgi:hypothetical protein